MRSMGLVTSCLRNVKDGARALSVAGRGRTVTAPNASEFTHLPAIFILNHSVRGPGRSRL